MTSFSKPLISMICMALLASSAVATTPSQASSQALTSTSDIMGFQAWKESRVEDARAILERMQLNGKTPVPAKATESKKNEASKSEQGSSRHRKAHKPDQKLQQAQIDLEIAQEFTVNDYFVLYLSQFKSRDAFVEAAKRLTPEETAELMMAFQRNLTGSGLADTGNSRTSPNVVR